MGTGDYIRRIYPEDDMEVFGKYLMYRFYPDFTQKRLAMRLPYPIPEQYRAAFDHEFATDSSEPDDPDPTKKRKKQGNSITLGLWAFQQEAHEPLDDVMMRYVQRATIHSSLHLCRPPGCASISSEENGILNSSDTFLVDRTLSRIG